jgi:hypothetical protein
VELIVRGRALDGPARLRTLTAERSTAGRAIADVETACLEEGEVATKGSSVELALPPQSFTTVELILGE